MMDGGNEMIDKYTAQAKTQEEAIEKGLKELGITRNQAEIQVNTPGKKGFLGFGAKDAVVTVTRKDKSSSVDQVLDDALPESKPLDVEAAQPVESEAASKDSAEAHSDQVADQAVDDKTLDPIQDSSETSGRAEVPAEADIQSEPVEVQAKAQAEEELDQEVDGPDKEDNSEVKETPIEENDTDQDAIDFVKDYLIKIIQHMGIEDVTIETSQDQQFIKYEIDTEDAGLVIGRHGKVLNGLQTLAQIQLHQRADNKLHAYVDAENYRSRRKDTVEHLAKKTARQVIDTNQSVILEPMPAHERKQIHRHLSRYDEVQTHSEGKEPHRYLVVEPKEV